MACHQRVNVRLGLLDWQIKREISIMKLVRHPNVVRLHEVSRCSFFVISAVQDLSMAKEKSLNRANVSHRTQVLASRVKIYIILEFVTGGELFDKIVSSLPNSC